MSDKPKEVIEQSKLNKEEGKKLGLKDRLSKLQEEKRLPIYSKEARIMIGVPILSWSHRFAISFLEFWTNLTTYDGNGRNFQVCYNFKYRKPVHIAENELAQDAINAGCTHLLLMDDDIYDVKVEDLLALLDADRDVVGGIMYTSGFPYALCAFRRYDQNTAVKDQPILKDSCRLYEVPPEQRFGIQPVDLIPFGFTLIKTEVFKKLEKPWFSCDDKAPTDSFFADTILNAKMQYFAHFGVWLCHNEVSKETQHLKMQIGFIESQKNDKGRIINLTPEEMATHEAMIRKKMADSEAKFNDIRSDRFKFNVVGQGAQKQVNTSLETAPPPTPN